MPITSSKCRASSKLLRPDRAAEIERAAGVFQVHVTERFRDAAHGKAACAARLGQQRADLFRRAVVEEQVLRERLAGIVEGGGHDAPTG